MSCPQCGGTRIARDYAPPRTYALMLLGLLLIVLATVFDPAHFLPPAAAQTHRILVFGIAILLYGFFDSYRHGNVYCQHCGMRFRRVAGDLAAETVRPEREHVSARPRAASAQTLDPNTPIEPLLKCLRFKNDKMRSNAADTLHRLTGEDFGADADAWESWWREHKEEYHARRRSS